MIISLTVFFDLIHLKKNTQLKQIFVLKYYIRIMIQTYNKLGILDSCPSAVYTWS